MKILVICQYYYPEPFRISDICEELVKLGHTVDVVTGIPNYPMGEIYEGYRKGEKRDEIINGVNVHRCFTIGRKRGAFYRFLNYYSYAFSSSQYVKRLNDDYDVVFVNQLSPVMMAKAGIVYKKKHHKKLVLYCLDLWPASLTAGGVKGGVIYKWFYCESKKIYHAADKILITSKSFSDYFEKEFNITDTVYLPQYAEDTFTPEQCRKEPDEFIDLMFAGNVGTAQSVDTIIKAAALCKDIENLRWHIVGDGSELENCKKLANNLGVTSVIFHGRKGLDEMPKYYAMADAMLVTMQKNPVLSMTLPGKVQSYMAAGKPIIGIIDGEVSTVIKEAKCGFCGRADNMGDLIYNIHEFIAADKDWLGKNAKKYFDTNFSRQMLVVKLEKILKGG